MNRLKSVEGAAQPAPKIEHNFRLLDTSLIWEEFTLGFSDFSAAAVSETILLKNLPSYSIMMGIRLHADEAWTGGSISAVTLEVGTTGDDDKYLAAFNVEGSPSGFGFNWNPVAEGFSANVPLKLTIRTSGGNVEDLAAGAATVNVGYCVVR